MSSALRSGASNSFAPRPLSSGWLIDAVTESTHSDDANNDAAPPASRSAYWVPTWMSAIAPVENDRLTSTPAWNDVLPSIGKPSMTPPLGFDADELPRSV